MKSATKICLVICAVLAALGLIFCIMGAMMGFGMRQFIYMAKEGAFTWHWDDSDIEFGDFEVGNEWTKSGGEKLPDDKSDWMQSDGSWDVAGVRNLDVDYAFGTLQIEPSNSGKIEVSVDYRFRWKTYFRTIEWELKGNTLKISDKVDKKIGLKFQHNDGDAVLTLRIPEDMEFDEITLDLGAGKISLGTNLMAKKDMDIEIGAGQIERTNSDAMLIARELSLDAGAGELIWEGIQADELNVSVGAGDMELTDVTVDNLNVDCGVGKILVVLAGSEQDYDYDIDCGIGNVQLGNASYGGLGRNKYIDNDGTGYVDIDCGIGEVEIKFMADRDEN